MRTTRHFRLRAWLAALFLITAPQAVPLSLGASSSESSEDEQLSSIRRQFHTVAKTPEAAEKLFKQFQQMHVDSEREMHRLLALALRGYTLDFDQSRRVMQTYRPVLQVDTLRRMVSYQVAQKQEDATEFYASRRVVFELMSRQLPPEYNPVVQRYSDLFDRIYNTYADAPQDVKKMNKAWLDELDEIRARELQLYGMPAARHFGRLPGLLNARNQDQYPICGATSLAMALETLLSRRVDPKDIASVIGWEGTTAPMMWAYAYSNSGVKNARLQVLSVIELKELLSRNVPVILFQQFSEDKPFGHARLVVGFNTVLSRIEYVESDQGGVKLFDINECEKLWAPLLFSALVLEN